MNAAKVCELLFKLNSENPSDYSENVFELLHKNIIQIELEYAITWNIPNQYELFEHNPVDKYLFLNVQLLNELKRIFANSIDHVNVLSVQQNKIVRDVLKEAISIGIRFNLQPKLPQRLKPASEFYANEEKALTTDYNRLCYTTHSLIDLFECDVLRPLILIVGCESILNALYQIVYCPLKQPQKDGIITEAQYEKFVADKRVFKALLEKCGERLPSNLYVKETMLLLRCECVWFKRAVSTTLTTILRSPNGVRAIASAMLLQESNDDSTRSWRALDVIAKLIASLRDAPDFESNICKQVAGLLEIRAAMPSTSNDDQAASDVVRRRANALAPFESLFVACARLLYLDAPALCERQFLTVLFGPLDRFADDGKHKFENNDDLTDCMQRTMRLLKLAFANQSVQSADLPYDLLTPYFVIVFKIYAVIRSSSKYEEQIAMIMEDLEEVLFKYIEDIPDCKEVFDKFLFNDGNHKCKKFRSDINLQVVNDCIKVLINSEVKSSRQYQLHMFMRLIQSSTRKKQRMKFQMKLFVYLLKCMEFKAGDSTRLSHDEVDALIEKNLLVYSVLAALVDDANIQQQLSEDPNEIVECIAALLESNVVHKCKAYETSDYNTAMLLIAILQALAASCKGKLDAHLRARIVSTLRRIQADGELATTAASAVHALDADDDEGAPPSTVKATSEFDKAIDDVCDPLLPMRAHGLMTLARLIECRHPDVMERKLFVLNVFQQNIKSDDSFIYLSAINGLALMGDVFPELVLETITEEYTAIDSTSSTKSARASSKQLDIRIKLGEVLVKVTRNLGEKAIEYKSVLINAFMVVSKDDEDHLMRASSLSNLGEVCQVLGYKLGSIVSEVLECVHAVITRDPAVEARRAAVTVIRQLFVGLEAATLAFLNDDIADIYRTLRRIYDEDADDVMRLQAQLALEELAANAQAFLFPNLRLKANQGEK